MLVLCFIILANRYTSLNNMYAYYNFYKDEIKLEVMDEGSRCSTGIIRYIHSANLIALNVFSMADY